MILPRILVLFLLVLLLIFNLNYRDFLIQYQLNNAILKSEKAVSTYSITRLSLLDSEKYYAVFGGSYVSCSVSNTYSLIEDTLLLDENIYYNSKGLIASKYYVSKTQLIPIVNDKNDWNTPILKIIKIE